MFFLFFPSDMSHDERLFLWTRLSIVDDLRTSEIKDVYLVVEICYERKRRKGKAPDFIVKDRPTA